MPYPELCGVSVAVERIACMLYYSAGGPGSPSVEYLRGRRAEYNGSASSDAQVRDRLMADAKWQSRMGCAIRRRR
jgi:hypothetical protein